MKPRASFSLSAGLLVAATGVGAGDLVLASLSGARFGLTLLWAIVVGAVLKYVLNEGLAKWEVATGTTLLAGWIERLPRVVALYFGVYLLFWAFLVAGTLTTYTGLVANTVFPLPGVSARLGTAVWGGAQSLLVVGLIHFGGFRGVERIMKVCIGLMFLVVVGSAVLTAPGWREVMAGLLVPRTATDLPSVLFVFALAGGVGGTLTILCYSYWLRERRGRGEVPLKAVRYDLGVAYALTAVFGIAVTVIAAGVGAEDVAGYELVTSIAERTGAVLGPAGYWAFMIGFWAAVLTSMIGVWNGVPYLFADFVHRYRTAYRNVPADGTDLSRTPAYRWFLLYLAVPPILLTVFEEPAWIGVAYALSGAFFMPFLAATLLYLNNRADWVGRLKNGPLTNLALLICLVLFVVLFLVKVTDLG